MAGIEPVDATFSDLVLEDKHEKNILVGGILLGLASSLFVAAASKLFNFFWSHR